MRGCVAQPTYCAETASIADGCCEWGGGNVRHSGEEDRVGNVKESIERSGQMGARRRGRHCIWRGNVQRCFTEEEQNT